MNKEKLAEARRDYRAQKRLRSPNIIRWARLMASPFLFATEPCHVNGSIVSKCVCGWIVKLSPTVEL